MPLISLLVGKNIYMQGQDDRLQIPHPINVAQSLFRAILEDHTNLSRFKKDCFCHDHGGPHAVFVSRKKLVENYAKLIESIKSEKITSELYEIINQILHFSEEERHRQAVLVKDLKMYVKELPELSA